MANNPPAKRGRGRPSSYDPDDLPRITKLCMLGLTNEQLAASLGVTTTTVDNWLKTNPEFLGAVKAGRIDADGNTVRSLWQRANGYTHTEEKLFFDSRTGEVVRAETTKHYPPDTAAAFIWLKNRHPELWRDRKEVDVDARVQHQVVSGKQLEAGEREALRNFLEQRMNAEDVEAVDYEENEDDDDGSDAR